MTFDNRHKIAAPYWARPGVRLFAKKVDDDEGGVEVDVDEEDDDEEDDDDPDAEKTEDELRAELKTIRSSLGKANGQSAKRRAHAKRLQAQIDELSKPKPKRKDDDDDDELDVDSIREQARREGEKAGNDRIKRAEARTALAKAGVTDDKALARLARMIDLDDLDLDDDGNVDGLDDAIDELRDELPQLFAQPRRRRTSVSGAGDRGGEGGARDRKPKSASEKAADQLLNRGRRD